MMALRKNIILRRPRKRPSRRTQVVNPAPDGILRSFRFFAGVTVRRQIVL
jgi:hypothetical protein